ncbi:MAG TPA: phosphoglucosamine mutase [Pirellulales bacterium]|nr:phosphoglucosamine mutase [Pirellulales bacterium]
MPSQPIISVSGLRGIVGESLTPEIAIRYACAFAAGLPAGPIVITRDGRTTGPMLAACLTGGLTAIGRNVVNGGVAATPTAGVLVRSVEAAGGIQISASHNPPEYNGFKLFSAEGRVIPSDAGVRVIERYRHSPPAWVQHQDVGQFGPCSGSIEPHWSLLSKIVDIDRIKQRQFKVLLDSNHGAGSAVARIMFERLGCRATIVGDTPDGRFEHVPEPTAENLKGILPLVKQTGADIGFCQDPDADRLAVIDETGRYLGEEYTLAMCVDHVLRSQKGPIVTNCSTSRMSADLAAKYGVPFYRSAVGEANVVDLMLRHSAILGGEGNGGVIDPRVGLVRDSFVGMALLLDSMAARQLPISQLADELPHYEIRKDKIVLPPEGLSAALDAIESHFTEARADRLDGLRLDWPDAWLMVRPSNTESIVRVFAEAPTADRSERLCAEAAKVVARHA